MRERPVVLIIDDQISVIKSLQRLLRKNQFESLAANSAKEAMALLSEDSKKIDLIISDQRMPEMTGTEFARQLRKDLHITIPFCILSGYSDLADIKKAESMGTIDLYIEKPWDNEDLIKKINEILNDKKNNLDIPTNNFSPEISLESSKLISEIREFNESINDLTFGSLAVEHKYITQEELNNAMSLLEDNRKAGRNVSIENILFELKLIDSDAMGRLIAATKRKMGISLCYKAINRNLISMDDMERVLEIQAKEFKNTTTCRFIGDILIAEGLISKDDRDLIIVDQLYSDTELSSKIIDKTNIFDRKKHTFFLKERAMDKIFGRIAVEKYFIQADELRDAMQEQIHLFSNYDIIKNIGEILVEKGHLSQENKSEILAKQNRLLKTTEVSTPSADNSFTTILAGYDNEFEITISADNMAAYIAKKKEIEEPYTTEDLKLFLNENDIVYGIVDDLDLKKIISNETNQNEKILIAKGKALVKGRAPYINYLFKIEYLSAGEKNKEGYIDYKIRGEIPFVEPGIIVAEIIPRISGESGITITGEEITPEPLEKITFDIGTGVRISDDGTKLISSISGQPEKSFTNKVSVLPLKLIKEDVGFNTGHIIFDGNVEVRGCLKNGFMIKATNITVNEINGGIIEATGNVTVKNGVIGGRIWSQGIITAGYIKDAEIFAYKDVYVKTLLMESKVTAGGFYFSERGTIVSSQVSAQRGGEVLNIGTEVSKPCKINISNDEFIKNELLRFDKKIFECRKLREEAQNDVETLTDNNNRIIGTLTELSLAREKLDAGKNSVLEKIKSSNKEELEKHNKMLEMILSLSDGSDRELDKIFQEQNQVFESITKKNALIKKYTDELNEIVKEKKKFITWSKNEKHKSLFVFKGGIAQGTIIEGKYSNRIVKDQYHNAKIYEKSINDNNKQVGYEIIIEAIAAK